eukprot:360835-Chlamydomonas_euryale.AAC.2
MAHSPKEGRERRGLSCGTLEEDDSAQPKGGRERRGLSCGTLEEDNARASYGSNTQAHPYSTTRWRPAFACLVGEGSGQQQSHS